MIKKVGERKLLAHALAALDCDITYLFQGLTVMVFSDMRQIVTQHPRRFGIVVQE